MNVVSQLIKADSVLLYFEGNYSFSLHCDFQFTRTHTEGETPDTNCIAKVNILGHIVAQGRRKKIKGVSFGHCPKGGGFNRNPKVMR